MNFENESWVHVKERSWEYSLSKNIELVRNFTHVVQLPENNYVKTKSVQNDIYCDNDDVAND